MLSLQHPSPTSREGRRKMGMAVATAALTAALIPAGTASAADATAASPVVTFVGSAGTLPASSAVVYVQAQLALDMNAKGVPQELDEVTVASRKVISGSFSVPIPHSATLAKAESYGHGIVNFQIVVVSGRRQTQVFVPAAPAAVTEASVQSSTAAPQVHVPAFPSFHAMNSAQLQATPASGGPSCAWYAYGNQWQQSTRIGEDHVANVPGVTDTFAFRIENDETVTAGLSYTSPKGNYSADGNVTITNSLSTNGAKIYGRNTDKYVNDDTIFQRYEDEFEGHSCRQYMEQAVDSEGDVINGSGTPKPSPQGSCKKASLHVTLQGGASWDSDHGRDNTYSGAVTIYGLSASASDGFTRDIEHDYSAQLSAKTTYICSPRRNVAPKYGSILYDTQ
jgi:hypothetical protein